MSARKARSARVLSLSVAVAAALAHGRGALADTYDWDVGVTPNDGIITGGAGDWNASLLNFTLNGGANNVAWPNTNAHLARFGNTGGAVSLTTPITANGLLFTADGYTIQNNGTAANNLTLGGTTPTIDVGTNLSATISAILVGGVDNTIYFTKTGDGTINLTGSNTFLGDVRIQNGTVFAQAGSAFGGGATTNGTRIILDQEAGKTATVHLNTGYDPAAASAASFDRYLFGPGGGTISVAGTATTQQTLLLNDANQFGDHTGATASTVFTKAGLGIVRLVTQPYTFSGSVVINEGTLQVETAGNLGIAGNTNPVTVNSGGTFDLRATLSNAAKPIVLAGTGWNNVGALVNGGTGTVAVGTVTLTANASVGGAGQLTLGSVGESPAASGFGLTKVGAALTILNATNTYTGNTTVSAGTLRDTTGTSLPNSAGVLLGNLNLAGGVFETRGTFSLPLGTSANQVQFSGGTNTGLSAAGAALTVNLGGAAQELVWGAGDFNPGNLILNGAAANNTLTLQNAIDLNAGAANISRTINVGANTATVSGLIRDSSTTNTGGLTKTGAGTLVLTNANNTYDGPTTINAGVLHVPSLPDGAISPIGSGNIVFTSGTGSGTFRYSGATPITTNRTFTVGANNAVIDVSNANGGLEILTSVNGNAANTITKAGPGTLTLSGTTDNASFVLNATAGTTLLNKSGLPSARAVAGISNISTGATVRLIGIGTDQIYGGNAVSTTGWVNMGGGTLDLNGKSESLGRLSGTGVVTNTAAGTTSVLTLGETNGISQGYAGAINDGASDGKVAVVKIGTGALPLLNASNYSGGTTVNAGNVRVHHSSALGTGPVTLAGGTLTLAATSLNGFGGDGTGYQINGGATVASDVLTLTTATGSLARSVYANSRVDTRGFTASFRYDNGTNGGGADGFTFLLQNQSLTALGPSGGARAYTGITPSVAITFNIYNADNTGVGSNGVLPTATTGLLIQEPTVPATLLDLADITVNYDGTTLSFTVTNPNNPSETISRNVAVDLPALLGGTGAFVGFTGATGGTTAVQTIANFSFKTTSGVDVTNAINLPASATSGIEVANLTTSSVGPLSLAANATLNVTGNGGGVADAPYTLTTGPTALASGSVVNVANNGAGTGTLATGGLAGSGSVNGAVRLLGAAAPGGSDGNGIGTLSITGTLTTENGASYTPETGTTGVSDLIAVSGAGTLDLAATDTLNVLPLVAIGGATASYTIATFGSLTGVFDSVLVNGLATQNGNPLAANYVNVIYPTSPGGVAGEIRLELANVAAVPEPAAIGVLACGAIGLLARRRRK